MRSLDSPTPSDWVWGRSGFRPTGYARGAPWAAVVSLLTLSWALFFDPAFGLAQDSPERAERVEGLSIAAQASDDYTVLPWHILLKRVVKQGLVDYEALQLPTGASNYSGPIDRTPGWLLLADYLNEIGQVDPARLPSKQAQLAFWINAYNANVVKGVLDHHPITSVKEVKGFFDRIRYRVAGRDLTLNEIEAEGRALGDWRIHFAVVCASSSCPILRAEAYAADRLETQLAEQTRQFLADPQRGLRIEGDTLWVSKIFKWYAKDFVPQGSLTAASLWTVINSYTTVEGLPPIADMQLKFLDYGWSLNVQRR